MVGDKPARPLKKPHVLSGAEMTVRMVSETLLPGLWRLRTSWKAGGAVVLGFWAFEGMIALSVGLGPGKARPLTTTPKSAAWYIIDEEAMTCGRIINPKQDAHNGLTQDEPNAKLSKVG